MSTCEDLLGIQLKFSSDVAPSQSKTPFAAALFAAKVEDLDADPRLLGNFNQKDHVLVEASRRAQAQVGIHVQQQISVTAVFR